MKCKNCNYPQSEVLYTRYKEQRNSTLRRRECLRCGLRFTTFENSKEPHPLPLDYYRQVKG